MGQHIHPQSCVATNSSPGVAEAIQVVGYAKKMLCLLMEIAHSGSPQHFLYTIKTQDVRKQESGKKLQSQ